MRSLWCHKAVQELEEENNDLKNRLSEIEALLKKEVVSGDEN